MDAEVVISKRFRGPLDSGNGGYVCGVLARALNTPMAEASLRRPPPLERPLRLEEDGDGIRLLDGEEIVADATPLDALDTDVPEAPPPDAWARAPSEFFDRHPFPECFVCGPRRDPKDALCIHPGPVEGERLLGCGWTPSPEFADGEALDERIVWAALDCPSGIAVHHFARDAPPSVLARLRGRIAAPVTAGQPHTVVGWPISREGRKHLSGTAIFDAGGEAVAWAEALWIELRA